LDINCNLATGLSGRGGRSIAFRITVMMCRGIAACGQREDALPLMHVRRNFDARPASSLPAGKALAPSVFAPMLKLTWP
jgi:hypothetical protein